MPRSGGRTVVRRQVPLDGCGGLAEVIGVGDDEGGGAGESSSSPSK